MWETDMPLDFIVLNYDSKKKPIPAKSKILCNSIHIIHTLNPFSRDLGNSIFGAKKNMGNARKKQA